MRSPNRGRSRDSHGRVSLADFLPQRIIFRDVRKPKRIGPRHRWNVADKRRLRILRPRGHARSPAARATHAPSASSGFPRSACLPRLSARAEAAPGRLFRAPIHRQRAQYQFPIRRPLPTPETRRAACCVKARLRRGPAARDRAPDTPPIATDTGSPAVRDDRKTLSPAEIPAAGLASHRSRDEKRTALIAHWSRTFRGAAVLNQRIAASVARAARSLSATMTMRRRRVRRRFERRCVLECDEPLSRSRHACRADVARFPCQIGDALELVQLLHGTHLRIGAPPEPARRALIVALRDASPRSPSGHFVCPLSPQSFRCSPARSSSPRPPSHFRSR